MYGSITYTDIINQIQDHGWKIKSQSQDATVIEKPVGAPGMVVIPLALVPVIGVILGVLWIALRGNAVVTIQRKLTKARVIAPGSEYDINTREELDMFLGNYNFKGHVSYYPVIFVGIAAVFVGGFLLQFMFTG
jgi:hypothetical protein